MLMELHKWIIHLTIIVITVLQLMDPELSSIISLPRSWHKFVTVRLSFLKFFFLKVRFIHLILGTNVLPVYVCVSLHKKVSKPLELELQMVMSHHGIDRNQACVFIKREKCSKLVDLLTSLQRCVCFQMCLWVSLCENVHMNVGSGAA